jgi:hypothetical protein
MSTDFLFSAGAIKQALSTITRNQSFEGRSEYVGASEVGTCMRLVAYRKLNPEPEDFPPKMAAILELGHLIEDLNVRRLKAILEESGAGTLDHTGSDQLFLMDKESPLACHPDGLFNLKDGFPEGGWATDHQGKAMVFNRLTFPNTASGKGVFEGKSTDSEKLKKWQRFGLPAHYYDQGQANMGLTGTSWCYLLVTNRLDLTENAGFIFQFNPARFEIIRERATTIMDHVKKGTLPKGEASRAPWSNGCSKCPVYKDCAQRGVK